MQGIQSRQLELNFYVSKVMRFLMMRWIFTSLVVTLLLVQLEALRLYSMSQAVSFNGYTSPLKSKPPLKVLLLVEPTPFNYVSGYANRFKEMLRHLKRAGDEVQILTPDPDPNRPKEFLGFPITSPAGFPLFIYKQVSLTLDFKRNIPRLIRSFKPDLIHVSSPSCIAVPAILWARLLKVPLVMSYHTDMAGYAKNYFPAIPNIVKALCDFAVKTLHRFADLTLCTSPQLKYDLQGLGVRRVDVWQKGINTEVFSPKFRNESMRQRLSDGHPDAPLLLYVGRLGVEKKIHRLKRVLERNPACRLVLVGKGPAEEGLRETFRGLPVHFAGQLVGEQLSQAFASCDIFAMPSDTETLGFVVMEALASGLPAVGVTAGGVVDIIEPGNTGFLAENCEGMEDFSACVGKLVQDTQLRGRMGLAAVRWAQGWSWEAATSRLRNEQYHKALLLFRARNEHGRHVPEIENAIMRSEL